MLQQSGVLKGTACYKEVDSFAYKHQGQRTAEGTAGIDASAAISKTVKLRNRSSGEPTFVSIRTSHARFPVLSSFANRAEQKTF